MHPPPHTYIAGMYGSLSNVLTHCNASSSSHILAWCRTQTGTICRGVVYMAIPFSITSSSLPMVNSGLSFFFFCSLFFLFSFFKDSVLVFPGIYMYIHVCVCVGGSVWRTRTRAVALWWGLSPLFFFLLLLLFILSAHLLTWRTSARLFFFVYFFCQRICGFGGHQLGPVALWCCMLCHWFLLWWGTRSLLTLY